MNNSYTDENIALIQQYLNNELEGQELADFEQAVAQDENFRALVDHYKVIKESFELKELMDRRKQLQMIKNIADDVPPLTAQTKHQKRKGRLLPLRRIASYAAVITLCFFVGRELVNRFGTTDSNLFSGGADGSAVLYDENINLIKLSINDASIVKDTTALNIIISKSPEPEARYIVTNTYVEIIFNSKDMPLEQLGGASIELILQKIDAPSIQAGLLKIDQDIYSIPFKNEDFTQLFE